MKIIPTYFGEIAISEGYINRKTLEECIVKYNLRKGQSRLLGEYMVKLGLLTQEQVERILKMQKIYKTRLDNEYFFHVGLKSKVLDYSQVRDLNKKYAKEAAYGNYLNVANLAIQEGYIPLNKAEEIVKSQEYQYFSQLKKQGKSVLRGYELVGSIVKLKRTMLYKGIQVELDRVVAVKVLSSEYETEENIRNFFGEAEATALFNHPNLSRVYDKGFDNHMYYYSMELIEGENLTERLGTEGRLQPKDALNLIRQIANALRHIHSFEQIHTKVNPRNITIRNDGVAKLIDLSSVYSLKRNDPNQKKMSKMPQYMAPEQFRPKEPLDVRTDIYGLGATFYRILTGMPPVSGKSLEEIRKNIFEQEPASITDIDFTIPEDLAKIVHRMIRKDVKKRYPEIKNVLVALRKILI